MDQRQQEYLEYYRVRMEKYRDNPAYTNSFQSEKAICDALETSADLNGFKEKMEAGQLALKNAQALTRDKETARKKMYDELLEKIRVQAPERILEIVDQTTSDMDLISKVNHIETENNIEITIDMFTSLFYSDFIQLENLEVWENADIPAEWKKEYAEWARERVEEDRKLWNENYLFRAREWKPGWEFNFDLIWEDRHRRVIPVPDTMITKRIEQFKKLKGI